MKKLALLVALAGTAHAGGLLRPNGISARGVGMGGAFTAWADDATAVYFNPAALDTLDPQVMAGGELIVGPRSYTPVDATGTEGAKQDATVVSPVPALGGLGRFSYDDRPSRFTLGGGVWNTFGGKVSFPVTGMSALDATQDAVIEAQGAAALHISDKLAIGGTFRMGYGLFSVDGTQIQNAFDAHLTASGVGVSMGWGALVRPTPTTRIGLSWRAPLRITTSGDGTVQMTGNSAQHINITHDQIWPQQVSLGGGWRPLPQLRLAAQIDWVEWSMVRQLAVLSTTSAAYNQIYPEDWRDTWTVRAGAEYQATPIVAVRGGAYFDSAAVPDRTLERQYFDLNKIGVAAGLGIQSQGWRVDAGIDLILPGSRTITNNTTTAFPADRNKAPGDYSGTLVTFELAGGRVF